MRPPAAARRVVVLLWAAGAAALQTSVVRVRVAAPLRGGVVCRPRAARRSAPQRSLPTRRCQTSPALDAVERAVNITVASAAGASLESLAPAERESVAIARRLRKRFDSFSRNGDCRRCWLQRAHCVCDACPPLEELPAPLRHVYVFMHHKEVLLAVDTAKMGLAACGRGVCPQISAPPRGLSRVVPR